MVEQGGGINFYACSQFLFQQGASARPPEQDLKNLERIPPQQVREMFPHQIRADERAVQIRDERNLFNGRRVRRWRHGFD